MQTKIPHETKSSTVVSGYTSLPIKERWWRFTQTQNQPWAASIPEITSSLEGFSEGRFGLNRQQFEHIVGFEAPFEAWTPQVGLNQSASLDGGKGRGILWMVGSRTSRFSYDQPKSPSSLVFYCSCHPLPLIQNRSLNQQTYYLILI